MTTTPTQPTERERLEDVIYAVSDRPPITRRELHVLADAILSAGFTLPKPEAEDRETARRIIYEWAGDMPPEKSEQVEQIAAALVTARAQMQARVNDLEHHLRRQTRFHSEASVRCVELEAALERARAALRFYSNPEHWSVSGEFLPASPLSDYRPDCGETARAALESPTC